MTSKFYLEAYVDATDALVCTVSEKPSEEDGISVELKAIDTRLAELLHNADPALKELLTLVATQAYLFGYEQS